MKLEACNDYIDYSWAEISSFTYFMGLEVFCTLLLCDKHYAIAHFFLYVYIGLFKAFSLDCSKPLKEKIVN